MPEMPEAQEMRKFFVASSEPIGLLNGSAIALVTMKQQAYELIKDAILYHRLQIGVTYSQDTLCNELNISRTPVREALLELQQEGYVTIMRGKGIQVIPVTPKRARDIAEARYHLEVSGCTLAALRRSETQLLEMEKVSAELASQCLSGDARTPYQLDRQFHRAIFLASGNTWMQEEIEKLRDNFLRFETQSAFDHPDTAEQVFQEHRGILTAIAAQDEKAAAEAMRYHMDCTAKRTLGHIMVESDE